MIIGVPLIQAGEVTGVIALAHTDPDKKFLPEQVAVIEQLAELASVAVENARLYELSRSYEAQLEHRVGERTRELSAMLSIANATTSSFDSACVFEAFFEELRSLIGISSGTLLVVSGAEHLRASHYSGPALGAVKVGRMLAMGLHHNLVSSGRRTVVIRDVSATDDALATAYINYRQANIQEELPEHIASWMGVPVIHNDRVIGMLSLTHEKVDGFTEAHAALAMAAATQGAMAIVNSQLHTRTVEAATLAERSRLARDLHDSVSQAVFGMVLHAKTMEQLAVIDPKRVLEPLPHVVSLAEAALTEMRALIFELQPESLQREGLLSALQKQAAAMRARHHLKIEEVLCLREPNAEPQVKEALYRIAVEALHNTVKYSRARLVTMQLVDSPERIDLQIADDGVGFDTQAVPYGHFGLRSMRERVAQLNGIIDIDSAPGHGTRIAVSIHKAPVGAA
jgi:signal transduction histidine kinase